MTAMEILRRIQAAYQEILGESLTGLYAHGSLALGGFCWERSDIDFLAVVNQPPSQRQKERLISTLLALDAECPPKGLEMSVVLASVCKPFQYPTPFELHFSNLHKQACRDDLPAYCRRMNGTDKDLAAHFTVVRKAGIVLCGKPVADAFGEVPRADYVDSIRADMEDAAAGLDENPLYVVLTLCRVLACLREGAVLSKAQGGEWGLEKLPPEYHAVIRQALSRYAGNDTAVDLKAARAFAAALLPDYPY